MKDSDRDGDKQSSPQEIGSGEGRRAGPAAGLTPAGAEGDQARPLPPLSTTGQKVGATFDSGGQCLHIDEAWKALFEASDRRNPWGARLQSKPDVRRQLQQQIQHDFQQAGRTQGGLGVSEAFVVLEAESSEEDVPVIFSFCPVVAEEERTAEDAGKDAEEAAGQAPAVRYIQAVGEVMEFLPLQDRAENERHYLETVGRMTMGIAHDLNNLLGNIVGYVELAKAALRQDASHQDTVSYNIGRAGDAAREGAAYIGEIQNHVRQRPQEKLTTTDLRRIVTESVEMTEPYWKTDAQRRGVQIALETNVADKPLRVYGSEHKLRRVLVNLLINAVEAMPEGGSIEVRASYDQGAGCAVVSVKDSGVGMSRTTQRHVFDPLFTTKGKGGTGAGLSTSRAIVEEQGGSIVVQSERGRGSTFTVLLPSAEEAAREPEGRGQGRQRSLPEAAGETAPSEEAFGEEVFGEAQSERAEAPGRTPLECRVLIVDDDPGMRETLGGLLRIRGCQVSEASSGREALETLGLSPGEESPAAGQGETAGPPFQILILDQGMKGMSGREVARRVKGEWPKLPIMLLTGNPQLPQQAGGETRPGRWGEASSDINVTVAKPYEIAEVTDIIRLLIEER